MAVDKGKNKTCRLVGGTFAHCISSLGAVNKYAAVWASRTYSASWYSRGYEKCGRARADSCAESLPIVVWGLSDTTSRYGGLFLGNGRWRENSARESAARTG